MCAHTASQNSCSCIQSPCAAVVELTGGNNVRALYGLTYVAAKLSTDKRAGKQSGGLTLARAAAETLTDMYTKRAGSEQGKMLSSLLKAQGVLGPAASK